MLTHSTHTCEPPLNAIAGALPSREDEHQSPHDSDSDDAAAAVKATVLKSCFGNM